MPTAYGYGRQSHEEQLEDGLPNQGARTRAYFDAMLRPNGVDRFIFIPDDSAVSARTNPFMLRVAGKTLMTQMSPGDHFIIDKIDRLWRSTEDFVDVMRMFKQRGITLHICNMMGASIQMGTPMGDFMLNIMVSIAQLESDQVSDRTKAAFKARRSQGKMAGNRLSIPLGCYYNGEYKRVGDVRINTLRLEWDEKYRSFMGEIVRLADEERMGATAIAKAARKHFIPKLGKDFWVKHIYNKRSIREQSICDHYWREKQYRALPPFDPNRILFRIFKSEDRWRDIGPNEPNTPNPFPFLDGRPIPTLEELYRIGG